MPRIFHGWRLSSTRRVIGDRAAPDSKIERDHVIDRTICSRRWIQPVPALLG